MNMEQEDKIIAQAQDILERRLDGTEYRIEEYLLDGEPDRGVKIWCVYIDIDNNEVIKAEVCIMDGSEFELKDQCVIRSCLGGKRCDLYIATDTMDRAIKIAKERYSAIKSNQYIWDRMNSPIPFLNKSFRSSFKYYHYFNFATNEFLG